MSEEVRRRVFEPFFTHGKAHGTGLGMAIVQRIVAEHGGSIRIDSTPGQGTTIELILPAAGPAAARA
jgi:signal transduction histidine kinase